MYRTKFPINMSVRRMRVSRGGAGASKQNGGTKDDDANVCNGGSTAG